MPVPSEEKLALFRAMHAAPDDRTPKLVYADWLEEREPLAWALDRATLAFIRASCVSVGADRMMPPAYAWLREKKNPWDLLPSVWALSRRDKYPSWKQSGRYARIGFNSRYPQERVWITAEFWCGFVRRFTWYSVDAFRRYARFLAYDQPLAIHEVSPHSGHVRTTSALVPEMTRNSLAEFHTVWQVGSPWMIPCQRSPDNTRRIPGEPDLWEKGRASPPWRFIVADQNRALDADTLRQLDPSVVNGIHGGIEYVRVESTMFGKFEKGTILNAKLIDHNLPYYLETRVLARVRLLSDGDTAFAMAEKMLRDRLTHEARVRTPWASLEPDWEFSVQWLKDREERNALPATGGRRA